jgi:hypothetical protein
MRAAGNNLRVRALGGNPIYTAHRLSSMDILFYSLFQVVGWSKIELSHFICNVTTKYRNRIINLFWYRMQHSGSSNNFLENNFHSLNLGAVFLCSFSAYGILN